ncbi:MAG: YhdH/YhfP family quinone oxidoreductase [Methylocystaceae bacterium]|nr:YhdH/YhfP family quinone oxidoreductase [Methylocystaceae bacterium]
MKAYRLSETIDGPCGQLVDMDQSELTNGDTLIKIIYAGINYKDALAGTGKAPIARHLPINAGIEAIGKIVETSSDFFQSGDWVIAHGMGLGVERDGGLSEYVRCDASWLVALPQGLKPKEAAILGVAGFSAALCVDRLEQSGLLTDKGPIAVTGASGGVGSLAISMLSHQGFNVTAISSKENMDDHLHALGASDVISSSVMQNKKVLEPGKWAAAIDTIGGDSLAWLIRSSLPDGIVISIGNAGGNEVNTNVIPFILRGISLLGINANSPRPLRQRIWGRLANDLKPNNLDVISNEINLEDVTNIMELMIAGKTKGRYIVKISS